MKGLFTSFVILSLVIYGGYSGFMALQFYLEMSNLVDEVVQRELPKVSDRGWRAQDRMRRIREAIVKAATQSSIPLDPAAIVVTEEAGVLWVKTAFQYEVVKLPGDKSLGIPIETSHSFNVPGEGR